MAADKGPAGWAVPALVAALAAGRPIRLAWENMTGGRTFEIGAGTGAGRCFVKWSPAQSGIDLAEEAARITWAAPFTSVPRLLGHGAADGGTWLMTAPLPGTFAVADKWKAKPQVAVRAIGLGLRAMHDALPVASCPFSWSAPLRLGRARQAYADGRVDPQTQWQPIHRHLPVSRALELAGRIPTVDRLVVCHGDSCAPNTLLTDDGRWSGHVDLGQLGLADRWADIAAAALSLELNYGSGWEPALLDAYGVEPDPERTSYYRLLWDLDA